MALNMHPPRHINWWLWGGGGLAIVLAIVAAIYGFDLIGAETEFVVPPSTD